MLEKVKRRVIYDVKTPSINSHMGRQVHSFAHMLTDFHIAAVDLSSCPRGCMACLQSPQYSLHGPLLKKFADLISAKGIPGIPCTVLGTLLRFENFLK